MYFDREKLEEIEAQTLAPYALLSKNSRGRFHHDHEPTYRTAFRETVTALSILKLSANWNIKHRFL